MTTKKARIPKDCDEIVVSTGRRNRIGIRRSMLGIECKDWLIIPTIDMLGNLLDVRITRKPAKTAEDGS